MCCNGGVTLMTYDQAQPMLNHANCADVTIGLLTVYLSLLECVQTFSLYLIIQETETTVADAKTLLYSWIALKQADPASCEYREKLPIVQAIVNKVVKYGRC